MPPALASAVAPPDAPAYVRLLSRSSGAEGKVEVDAVETASVPSYVTLVGGRSVEVRAILDCAARTLLVRSLDVHPQVGLGGPVVDHMEPAGWRQALPGSMSGRVFDAGCTPDQGRLASAQASRSGIPSGSHGRLATPPALTASDVAPALNQRPSVATGPYLQLAAVDNRAAAQDLASKLATRFPSLAHPPPSVTKAQVHGRVIYRVLFSASLSLDAARSTCAVLAAAGQACLVRSSRGA